MLKKIALGAGIALGMLASLRFFASAQDTDTLVLGTMSGWPPFVQIAPDGSYEGFDIDIARIIAQRLNKKLVIKDMDTAMLISALEQGQVDFLMTGLDITAERRRRITMIPYQGKPITAYPLIFYKEVPQGIETLDDLTKIPNAIICAEGGSSQEEVLKNYQGFTIKQVDPLVSLLELKNGRATASLLDEKMFAALQQKDQNLVAKMMPLRTDEIILGCGIGVKKSNTALTSQITSIIEDFKKSGQLAELEDLWIKGGRS